MGGITENPPGAHGESRGRSLAANVSTLRPSKNFEEALILADLGTQTTEKILQEVTRRVKQKTIEAGAGLQAGVIETVRDILLAATPASAMDMPARPVRGSS